MAAGVLARGRAQSCDRPHSPSRSPYWPPRPTSCPLCPVGHRGCARCSPDDTDSNARLRCFASWLGNLPALPSLRTLPRFRSSLENLTALPSLRTLPRFRSSLGNLTALPSLRTLPRSRSSLGNLPALPSLRTLPRFRSSLGNLPELFRSATGLTLYWRQMSRCLPTLTVCDACPTEGGS